MRTLDLDQFWPIDPEHPGVRAAPRGGLIRHSAPKPPPVAQKRFEPAPPRPPQFEFGPTPTEATARISAAIFAASATGKYQSRVKAFLSSFDAYAASWASIGFVSGMIAWHAVGFWGFISATVLARNDAAAPGIYVNEAASQHLGSPTAQPPLITGSLPAKAVNVGACVSLLINRASGVPSTAPCELGAQPLKDAGRQRRGNLGAGEHARLEKAETWTTATGTNSDPAGAALNPEDFDLTVSSGIQDAQIKPLKP